MNSNRDWIQSTRCSLCTMGWVHRTSYRPDEVVFLVEWLSLWDCIGGRWYSTLYLYLQLHWLGPWEWWERSRLVRRMIPPPPSRCRCEDHHQWRVCLWEDSIAWRCNEQRLHPYPLELSYRTTQAVVGDWYCWLQWSSEPSWLRWFVDSTLHDGSWCESTPTHSVN